MESPDENTAALVVVGNEILSAKTADENSPFLLRRLHALGVRVEQLRLVPDRFELLVEALRDCMASARWVFSTGGIGPTHDDITIEAIARATGRELVESPELVQVIRDFYREGVTEAHLRMAWLPEGFELVPTDTQAFPVLKVENLFVLPGSPGLARAQFLGIQERFRGPGFHLRRFRLEIEEGLLAAALTRIDTSFPDVEVGSYPLSGLDLLITLEGHRAEGVEAAARELRAALPEGCPVREEVGAPER